MFKYIICLILISIVALVADPLPTERRVDWANVAGVRAGTNTYAAGFGNVPTNIYNTNWCCADLTVPGSANVFDSTGVTNSLPALYDALTLAPNWTMIMLPAGTYWITNDGVTPSVLGKQSYVVLNGAGPQSTILKMEGSTTFNYEASVGVERTNLFHFSGGDTVYELGSSNITIVPVGGRTDVQYLVPGKTVYISELTNSLTAGYGYEGNGTASEQLSSYPKRTQHQKSVITEINNGTNLVIWPPLLFSFTNTHNPDIFQWSSGTTANAGVYEWFGFQNLTIMKTNRSSSSEYGVKITRGRNFWFHNVEFIGGTVDQLYVYHSLWANIQHCIFRNTDGGGDPSGDYGVEYHGANTGFLVYNNIGNRVRTLNIVSGSAGSVFFGNYLTEPYNIQNAVGRDFSVHATYPHMNLAEHLTGEVRMGSDFTHGRNGYNVWHRVHPWSECPNNIGYSPITGYRWGASFNHSSLYNSMINSVLMRPGHTISAYETSNSNGRSGSLQYVWDLGYQSDGVAASTDQDTRVGETLIRAGIYDFATETTLWTNATEEASTPDSYYWTSEPYFWDWFGETPWPAISAVPTVETNLIPAQKRWHDYIVASNDWSLPITMSSGSGTNPPSIFVEPSNTTITEGDDTTLSVSATGDGTLTYQWYTGIASNTTSPISNATNSTINVSPITTTTYWVRVTNDYGTDDSTTATVTVNPPSEVILEIKGNAYGRRRK